MCELDILPYANPLCCVPDITPAHSTYVNRHQSNPVAQISGLSIFLFLSSSFTNHKSHWFYLLTISRFHLNCYLVLGHRHLLATLLHTLCGLPASRLTRINSPDGNNLTLCHPTLPNHVLNFVSGKLVTVLESRHSDVSEQATKISDTPPKWQSRTCSPRLLQTQGD